jgi:alkanesulfonate monooxygenase SsuD/methylene tetrahydromethanopterin reductase-like flavin-dependent oxidoreductase (luciferase family)
VILGGNSEPAVRRAGRIGDGWFPYTITAEDFAERAELLRSCAREAGRAEDAVEITAWPGSCDRERQHDVNWVRRFTDAGATRLVLAPNPAELAGPRGLDVLRERIEQYRESVLDKL